MANKVRGSEPIDSRGDYPIFVSRVFSAYAKMIKDGLADDKELGDVYFDMLEEEKKYVADIIRDTEYDPRGDYMIQSHIHEKVGYYFGRDYYFANPSKNPGRWNTHAYHGWLKPEILRKRGPMQIIGRAESEDPKE